MNVFRLWSKRDPKIAHVRPLVDPRVPQQANPDIERIWRDRVKANVAQRAARKQTEQKINAIAAEYA